MDLLGSPRRVTFGLWATLTVCSPQSLPLAPSPVWPIPTPATFALINNQS